MESNVRLSSSDAGPDSPGVVLTKLEEDINPQLIVAIDIVMVVTNNNFERFTLYIVDFLSHGFAPNYT